jgi:hypothetical protein
MGFWSTVGNIAKGAVDQMAATSQEAEALAEDYRREDDDYLKRKLKSGSMAQKIAASKVLKERGYGNQNQ